MRLLYHHIAWTPDSTDADIFVIGALLASQWNLTYGDWTCWEAKAWQTRHCPMTWPTSSVSLRKAACDFGRSGLLGQKRVG